MDFSQIASEDKIRRAYEDGEFNDLPGLGEKLKLEDLSAIPQELRMAYKMMKNAGIINEETELRKELLTIEDLIDKCQDDGQRAQLQGKLTQKKLRLNQVMKTRKSNSNSAMFKNYETKINSKF
ncbi:DnaJ family domain-containing protein [Litchfieldia alkalitelluris]|uniref:DnaJ family domain-containing protein n=1 Tax=Litchfieldia alkalitelluris TaxID=304268 RepID=UPI0009986C32|nr:DnaJ family domain-containing protein [Litchfieldia alkalitelluris]